jgi:uncharacterized membrane protein YdjX (TVP38/TMEM64 family)
MTERNGARNAPRHIVNRSAWGKYASFAVLASILVGAALLVRAHESAIATFIDHHAVPGLGLYLLLNVLDAIAAPGATLPLIPIASRVWGRTPAALATTIGWTAGSMAAFVIARRWGYPIVRHLTSIRRVREAKRFVPENLFWSIVLVRLILPMDVVSYVLGLFTHIPWWEYLAATALGLTPSAFVLAYVGQGHFGYQLIAIVVVVAVMLGSLVIKNRRDRLRLVH